MPVLSTLTGAVTGAVTGTFSSALSFADPRNATLGRIARLLAVIALLANLKVIPFFWHSRFWYALYIHLLSRRRILPNHTQLFQPIKIVTRSPLYECDFNYHKSNSTYFSDLDIARTHLVAHLIKKSLRLRKQKGDQPLYVALAGVNCLFRREIKPYEAYEVWSRVLSWDEKWFWVVSHFVSVKNDPKTGKKKIYASALSKYVFKVGRKTIPPVEVLEESGLLPKRPANGAPAVDGPSYAAVAAAGTSAAAGGKKVTIKESAAGLMESADLIVKSEVFNPHLQHLDTDSNAGSEISRSVTPAPSTSITNVNGETLAYSDDEEIVEMLEKVQVWDWETIERLRKQGLKIAHRMLALDALEGEFEKGNERSGQRSAVYPASVTGLSWA